MTPQIGKQLQASLKPCAICESKGEFWLANEGLWLVRCTHCAWRGRYATTPKGAAKLWNDERDVGK
jgi:hypothetical protein